MLWGAQDSIRGDSGDPEWFRFSRFSLSFFHYTFWRDSLTLPPWLPVAWSTIALVPWKPSYQGWPPWVVNGVNHTGCKGGYLTTLPSCTTLGCHGQANNLEASPHHLTAS